MNSIRHLVLGAARSGKTRFALNTAKSLAHAHGREVIYVATAEAHDAEMRERIARHRAERPTSWQTLEAPRDLARSLASIETFAVSSETSAATKDMLAVASETSAATQDMLAAASEASASDAPVPLATNAPVIIVDCLTLWLSNALLHDFRDDDPTASLPTWARERAAFLNELERSAHTIILVSNEVGGGVVPVSPLARRFQSEQGWLNQHIASLCERVTLVVAGLPITIKAP